MLPHTVVVESVADVAGIVEVTDGGRLVVRRLKWALPGRQHQMVEEGSQKQLVVCNREVKGSRHSFCTLLTVHVSGQSSRCE